MASNEANETKPGGISKYQQFTTETVHRSQFKNATYNPRHLPQRKKLKLRETLAAVGLVQPIVWNKKTGNIVGGHQRLAQIDTLEGTEDYSLTVAVVDVDDQRERELNLLLNNPEVCGEWDLEALKKMMDSELDLINTGFDHAELMKLFGEAPSQSKSEQQTELSDQLKNVKDAYEKLSEMNRTKDDTDFYNVVVFGSYNERLEFLKEFGFEDNRYIDGRSLIQMLRDFKEQSAASDGAKSNGKNIGKDKAKGAKKPA